MEVDHYRGYEPGPRQRKYKQEPEGPRREKDDDGRSQERGEDEKLKPVNGPRNLLTLGRVIFLPWRGWRSAVCVISASVFRGSTAALDRRVRGRRLDQSIRADVLGNKIGVLTEPIA